MEQFRVSRAIGLSLKSWGRNFLPFTLLTAVLYSPAVIWIATMDLSSAHSLDDLLNRVFLWPIYLVTGLATLLAPMLTYRVVQELNGVKVSMLDSMKYGVRGIVPAIILSVVVNVLQQIPFGGILGAIVTCYWFVAAPAAVAEKLGPFAALTRSSVLTQGRRWGIFGLTFLIGIALIALLMVWIVPMFDSSTGDILANLKQTSLIFVCIMGLFHMFTGIVEAVSYALLREDKDGLSYEQLAKVFE